MSNQDGRLLNPLSRRSYEKIGDCERPALSISYDSWISLRASSPGRCGGGALPFSTPRPPPPPSGALRQLSCWLLVNSVM